MQFKLGSRKNYLSIFIKFQVLNRQTAPLGQPNQFNSQFILNTFINDNSLKNFSKKIIILQLRVCFQLKGWLGGNKIINSTLSPAFR